MDSPTPLVGREQELTAICGHLREPAGRLLTLTGPPGIGKTHLARAVAATLAADFPDGVTFVPLAAIADPAQVPAAIAQALGLKEAGPQSLPEQLHQALRAQRALLVLDNFEQVTAAGPGVGALLQACPGVRVLVTSRAPLQVAGEQQFAVPPLALPTAPPGTRYEVRGTRYEVRGTEGENNSGPADANDPDLAPRTSYLVPHTSYLEYGAVALFVQRAQAVQPTFALTDANARAVAAICAEVDGLPLAIELVAGWVQRWPPEALLARLYQRLALLTGGPSEAPRGGPARWETLRAAIDWSYALLTPAEQALFARLGVFVGGATLEAAEAVVEEGTRYEVRGTRYAADAEGEGAPKGHSADMPSPPAEAAFPPSIVPRTSYPVPRTSYLVPHTSVLDGLGALVDKSLLRREPGAAGASRFVMLETIREYALEQLAATAATAPTRAAHARTFLALATTALPYLEGPQQIAWLDRLDAERDNLRAALAWSLELDDDPLLGLQLASALGLFWFRRGYWTEGRTWLTRVLAAAPTQPTKVRARALSALTVLTCCQGDYPAARHYAIEHLALRQAVADPLGILRAYNDLGIVAYYQGNLVQATIYYEQGLAVARRHGTRADVRSLLVNLGVTMYHRGDLFRARTLDEEALGLARALGDEHSIATLLGNLGEICQLQGEYPQAQALYEEALHRARALGAPPLIGAALEYLAYLALARGDLPAAAPWFRAALVLFTEIDEREGIVGCLAGLAAVAAATGQAERAARLGGAVAAQGGYKIHLGSNYGVFEQACSAAQTALSPAAWAAAWAAGQGQALGDAVAAALAMPGCPDARMQKAE